MSLRWRRAALLLLLAAAAWHGGRAGWIGAKAHLAQHLVRRAWHAAQSGTGDTSPWPWADTRPVARLLVNEATAQNFHWLLVESLEASYDIVADPSVVSGEITQGGTIECACWMFGRILG